MSSNEDQKEKAHDSDKQHKDVLIILNGNETPIQEGHYSYEEIYKLAWPTDPIPTDDSQPITYKLPKEKKTHSLLPGEKPIHIKEGMIIDVTPSTKS